MPSTGVSAVGKTWGTVEFAAFPGMAGDAEWARYVATTTRGSMTPRAAAAQFEYVVRTNDVRRALR
jgi:hypothetical protein